MSRVVGYSSQAPVPGWCSNKAGAWPRPELSLDTGHAHSLVIRLNFSLAAVSHSRDCNNREDVQYRVYQRYLARPGWGGDEDQDLVTQLFLGLRKFKDVESIETWGTQVSSLGTHRDRLVFASYAPVGSVYAVVATADNGSSVYGLGHSYGCQLDPATGLCVPQAEALTLMQVFSAFSVFAGLLLAFAGHKYFLVSQVMFGFYAGLYVGYILLHIFCTLDFNFLFFLVMACGVCMAVMVVSVWIFLGIPVLSVLLPTIEVGVVLASVVLYLPQTNTLSLTVDLHYWLVFLCLVLAAPICLLAFTHKAHILACVLVGTTVTVLPVDFYLGTGLRFIFLNVLRRSYVPQYRLAILAPLFQSGDLVLLACWLALAALALLCQLMVQRRKPPFPPSPFQQWRWRREAAREDDEASQPLLAADEDEGGLESVRGRVVRPPAAVVGFIQSRGRERGEAQRRQSSRDIFKPSAPLRDTESGGNQ